MGEFGIKIICFVTLELLLLSLCLVPLDERNESDVPLSSEHTDERRFLSPETAKRNKKISEFFIKIDELRTHIVH